MIFSTKSEYGVMMMTVLARHYGKGPLSLTDIAAQLATEEASKISVAYLEQIVPGLRKAGLLESIRGAKGGYVLALPPDKVSMGVVIRALEERKGAISVMKCATLDGTTEPCNFEEVCTAPILWLRVRDAITQALNSTMLSDLVPDTRRSLPMAFGTRIYEDKPEQPDEMALSAST
jgi:Rrf2 family transcriptional regulator, cysteine metabolism repressor